MENHRPQPSFPLSRESTRPRMVGCTPKTGRCPHVILSLTVRLCDNWRMEITVRFFALYRERAGLSSLEMELPDGATVTSLTDAVRQRFPRLAPPEVKIVVAVNAEYAEPEQALKPGDDVCLIPPVSGG